MALGAVRIARPCVTSLKWTRSTLCWRRCMRWPARSTWRRTSWTKRSAIWELIPTKRTQREASVARTLLSALRAGKKKTARARVPAPHSREKEGNGDGIQTARTGREHRERGPGPSADQAGGEHYRRPAGDGTGNRQGGGRSAVLR